MNSAFDEFLDEKHAKRDFYPAELRNEIDEINSWVYDLYNNGVYKVIPLKFANNRSLALHQFNLFVYIAHIHVTNVKMKTTYVEYSKQWIAWTRFWEDKSTSRGTD